MRKKLSLPTVKDYFDLLDIINTFEHSTLMKNYEQLKGWDEGYLARLYNRIINQITFTFRQEVKKEEIIEEEVLVGTTDNE